MSLAHQIKPAGASVPAPVKRQIGLLPAMVKAAADKLASASAAAEVLDAKDAAALTYDAAKRAARIAKAKQAHDDLIAAAHRAQADALDIEAAAKRRLADEYDGGQDRGEIATRGRRPENVPDGNIKPTASEVGLTRKDVHDARRVRDAEKAKPGVVRQALDEALDQGKEPTRAVVNAAVAEALGEAKPADTRSDEDRELDALQSAWDRAGEGARKRFIEINQIGGVPHADRAGAVVPPQSAAPARPAKPLRPHCQKPEACGGYGANHCRSCLRAIEAA